MRKRVDFAVIALVAVAGLAAGCGDTGSSGSKSPVTRSPTVTVTVGDWASPTVESVTSSTPPVRMSSATAVGTPADGPPSATVSSTLPNLPPYRPPTTGKPLRPTGPITPPPPIIAEDPADGGRSQRHRTPEAHHQRPVTDEPATDRPGSS
ncbi:hypothetical protein ACWT_5504 [Actinoplanes sp. SE50]|uniref:hypothetical protein n=1 Tax=unclassified Actinoplanes TaxID=2626549 RepID=UPI00023EC9FD|nr:MULTISPECIES: hypothetical protein [unclassified Actinoplanes]AEV86521.1 hypothetical protein ACPL_5634 [Actinoplanes sp. SE50/110]ATO84919.1 hypothetical protein ACWT_5504 [Actinoplanes sp. SE50]SLM02328.1 hypothetical protein ACSP50_5567 [Actinoplanes sp. SE50/110]